MTPNFLILPIAALVPLIIGFIWYNDALFGKAWMKENHLTKEQLQKGNMMRIFGLTYLLGLFLAVGLMPMVIHQMHLFSVLADTPGFKETGSEVNTYFMDFMSQYGQNFRTFKHGMFHGMLGSIFIALPVLGINALFERKSFKYIAIHLGYWALTMGIMGGIICQWG